VTLVTLPSAGVPLGARRRQARDADRQVNAAGVMLRAPSGKVLFLKRSNKESNFANHWALPGGGVDAGEDHEDAARRECREEIGFRCGSMKPHHKAKNGFHTFVSRVASEFKPRLNGEHTAYQWSHVDQPPQPLHPGVSAMLDVTAGRQMAGGMVTQAGDEMPAYGLLARPGIPFTLALDRSTDSVRAKDHDGHLHVKVTPISKATVNPYLGKEIPFHEELGLDPDKTYMLLRDPEELRKAAHTFSGKPLLIVHKPLNSNEHPTEKVIGAVGTNPRFDGTYVQAPLTVWTQQAINLIENGKQKELSSGYRYRAVMTPGTYKGMKFDGVMRDIQGNHVALVVEGRAGHDVVVGDSKENIRMASQKLLTRKAAVVQGALHAFLAPLLAEDGMPDLTPGLRGITNGNYAQRIPKLTKYVAESVRESLLSGVALAEDATPEGLHVLLEALSKVAPAEEAMAKGERGEGGKGSVPQTMTDAEPPPEDMGGMEPGVGEEEPPDSSEPEPEEDPQEGEGGEGVEGIKMFLKGELSPEAFAKLEQMLQGLGGGGEAPEMSEEEEAPDMAGEADEAPDDDQLDEGEPNEEEDQTGEDEPPMFSGKPKIPGKDKGMNKGAMDEASTKGLITAAVLAERAAQKALHVALDDARLYVGNLVGCDSAEQVYVKALGIKGIKADRLKGATVGILQEMLHMQPLKTRRTGVNGIDIAQDEKNPGKGYFERFPTAARIGHA
jgi:8-oxo-dGTP pyrophosphatase MutT (NUDIX family)